MRFAALCCFTLTSSVATVAVACDKQSATVMRSQLTPWDSSSQRPSVGLQTRNQCLIKCARILWSHMQSQMGASTANPA